MTGLFKYQGFGVLSEWNGQIRSPSAQLAMLDIAGTGANSIEITPRIWTSTATSNVVFDEPSKTESDASLIQGIQNAHADGLKVILKPNISTLDRHGSSDLAPTDVAAFFDSYKAEVVNLAKIAQQTGVEVFALGNEMSSLSGAQYKSYWTDIINSVRSVYSGELTYAAATDEASKVSFWDQLDTIGVNTYPPLSVPDKPTVADIVDAWHQVPTSPYWAKAFNHLSPVDFLHSLAEQYGKPVLMTEAGYRSIDYGSVITGNWKSFGTMDLQEQASAYEAFLQVWSKEAGPWLEGVQFWQWDLDGKFSENGFSPMDKPAQDIVTEYFKGFGSLLADGIAALTDDQVAQLADAGIKTIVATDHDVTISESLAASLGANHISLSEPYGHGSKTLTWNADGSLHDTHFYVVNDEGYTDYDVVYGANGQAISATYADGLTKLWTYNADGSLHEFVLNNISERPWTTTDTIYGETGKPVSETWHNGSTLIQSETWNADGTVHDIHYFNITGHDYTDYDVFYGANGKPASAVYSNGLTSSWTYNADGSLHEFAQNNISGEPWTKIDTIYGSSGNPIIESRYDGETLVQTKEWNQDGSVHDIHYFNVSGHAYTDYDVLYGANGKPASASYSNGMTETWSYNADNSLHSIAYEGGTDANYSSYTAGYGENRENVVQQFISLNGSETVRGYADHLTFTSSSSGQTVTASGGENFNFAPNANVTLTGGGIDQTFVFHDGFGHVTVTDFVPNSQPNSDHDTIVFSAESFADFSDLMDHASQSGTSTIITGRDGDSLALKHVAMSHLTAADFLIV